MNVSNSHMHYSIIPHLRKPPRNWPGNLSPWVAFCNNVWVEAKRRVSLIIGMRWMEASGQKMSVNNICKVLKANHRTVTEAFKWTLKEAKFLLRQAYKVLSSKCSKHTLILTGHRPSAPGAVVVGPEDVVDLDSLRLALRGRRQQGRIESYQESRCRRSLQSTFGVQGGLTSADADNILAAGLKQRAVGQEHAKTAKFEGFSSEMLKETKRHERHAEKIVERDRSLLVRPSEKHAIFRAGTLGDAVKAHLRSVFHWLPTFKRKRKPCHDLQQPRIINLTNSENFDDYANNARRARGDRNHLFDGCHTSYQYESDFYGPGKSVDDIQSEC